MHLQLESTSKFKVLIVDDEPDKRQLLSLAMEMAGYTVITAVDGVEGLAAVDQHKLDLVITDVMMPNMDGYEFARRLRSNPSTRYIPIIIQTAAKSTGEDPRRGAQVGALAYITDPTDLDLLLAKARTLLDFKNYIDALEEIAAQAKQGLQAKVAKDQAPEGESISQSEQEVLERLRLKMQSGSYDVFLCHNSEDKDAVKEIGKDLQRHGVLPWLDEWALRPGLPWQEVLEQQISQIKSVAVFVGKNGFGPWQQQELNAFLREFVARGCPVIPILLTDAPQKPELPIFLKGMTWVDFRKQEPDPLTRLLWGVTGESNWPIA